MYLLTQLRTVSTVKTVKAVLNNFVEASVVLHWFEWRDMTAARQRARQLGHGGFDEALSSFFGSGTLYVYVRRVDLY